MKYKSGLKTLASLASPSWLELTVCSVVFVILALINQLSEGSVNQLTSLGAVNFKGTFLAGISRWISSLFASSDFSTAFDYIFWFLVGVVIYIIASRLVNNAEEFIQDISLRHYIWPKGSNKNRPFEEFVEKAFIRVFTFIIFCFFIIRFLPVLDHWWAVNHVYTNLSAHTFEIYLLLLIFVSLFIHGVVIALRLLLLRRRILAND